MHLEHTVADLLSENEQLHQDRALLKLMLSVVQENVDLRARIQSSSSDTREELPVCSTSRIPPSSVLNSTNERKFREDMQQTRFQQEKRTSSPLDFKSFMENSTHTGTSEGAEFQSCHAEFPVEVKGQNRLLGEVAYQLDMRILSYVFPGLKRHYGFTLLNIPQKIVEVSTHPLTGKLDEGYQLHLSQRYADLTRRLNQFGYKTALHPQFTEFIVNNYGILKDKPRENCIQEMNFNNPDFLRKLIITTAPRKLQKDLLLVLSCLCNFAEEDRKPLFLW
ncbi:speriolin-like protein [Sebastes umbrosus]|uniref:speriolin-like protein n=1 Tax=Sebastes umbrosus TaxID=72105 RepID=UPI00189F045A|nr:speriolin-like protein [Sebastes umbrosus]